MSSDSPSLPLLFCRVFAGQAVTIINFAFHDILVLYYFSVHMGEELFLSLQKALEVPDMHSSPAAFVVPQCLELFTDAFFQDLEPIFAELEV